MSNSADPHRTRDADPMEREAKRVLRRLSEPGAFLAIAAGADVACVFRQSETELVKLAKTPVAAARVAVSRDWISCESNSGRLARYAITAVGRAWLKRSLAEDAEAKRKASGREVRGFADGQTKFQRQHQTNGERRVMVADGEVSLQVNLGETPLGWLAKRKGANGEPFLSQWEVAAGERLRDDFERAQIGPRVAQDWRKFLTPAQSGGAPSGPALGPTDARNRVTAALEALGPGLNDAVLRACCFLEGLEATERRMGWAARSGKVVLKIALGRLAAHYGFGPTRAEREAS